MATKYIGILERTSQKYSAAVKDLDGQAIAAAQLGTMTLTLYSLHSLAIVNARNQQNVLNANNVTIDSGGNLVWQMQPADNQILDATLAVETHRALFEYTWDGGTKHGKHEVDFFVRNLNKVT